MCLNNRIPKYLRDLLHLRIPNQHAIRLDNDYLLLVHQMKPRYSKTYGAFSHSAPTTWNQLPYYIRSLTDITAFKRALKGHYF